MQSRNGGRVSGANLAAQMRLAFAPLPAQSGERVSQGNRWLASSSKAAGVFVAGPLTASV